MKNFSRAKVYCLTAVAVVLLIGGFSRFLGRDKDSNQKAAMIQAGAALIAAGILLIPSEEKAESFGMKQYLGVGLSVLGLVILGAGLTTEERRDGPTSTASPVPTSTLSPAPTPSPVPTPDKGLHVDEEHHPEWVDNRPKKILATPSGSPPALVFDAPTGEFTLEERLDANFLTERVYNMNGRLEAIPGGIRQFVKPNFVIDSGFTTKLRSTGGNSTFEVLEVALDIETDNHTGGNVEVFMALAAHPLAEFSKAKAEQRGWTSLGETGPVMKFRPQMQAKYREAFLAVTVFYPHGDGNVKAGGLSGSTAILKKLTVKCRGY